MNLFINIDGACRGNPGPSSVGVVIKDASGRTLQAHGRAIGIGTNNTAEFTALIDALLLARKLGGTSLSIRSDSQLLVRQYSGQYRVKNVKLKGFLDRIHALAREFTAIDIAHVPREENSQADALANEALDRAPSPDGSVSGDPGA